MKRIKIDEHLIGESEPCFILAEVGVNHNGDVDLSKRRGKKMEIPESLSQMKEELKREIIDEILDVLRDELEENFREDFVRRVEQAELRVKEGEVSQYTPEEFKRVFS